MVKRNAWFLRQLGSADLTMVPPMRRLLSPVNAGMSAARHVLWYLSYYSSTRQR
jgi:hypothetical protein